jgi:hypothetical protein
LFVVRFFRSHSPEVSIQSLYIRPFLRYNLW